MEVFKENEIRYAVNSISKDIILLLMEEKAMSMEEAMQLFFHSDTFAKLQDVKTGLVFQSYLYVYSFLENEMKYGTSR